MEKTSNSQQKHSLFALAAAMAPVIHSASMIPWPAALAIAAAAMLLGRWCRWDTGWVGILQKIWGSILISVWMGWSRAYWPDMPFVNAVPLMLLALTVWTIAVPGKSERIGTVLLWLLVILLGAVLLSGIPEIDIDRLKPKWKIPELSLLPMLMLPFLYPTQKTKGAWKISAAAVCVSAITTGVLSTAVAETSASGIYELSRSLSLLGMAERFESLVAAAMTIGLYTSMTYLMESSGGKKRWIYPAVAVGIYLIGISFQGWILALGSILVWIVLPRTTGKNNLKK